MSSRLAGHGVSGDPIRDDMKDRDFHQLQPLLHRPRHVAERQVCRDEDPCAETKTAAIHTSNQQKTTAVRGANLNIIVIIIIIIGTSFPRH